jgi:hypothetical protein
MSRMPRLVSASVVAILLLVPGIAGAAAVPVDPLFGVERPWLGSIGWSYDTLAAGQARGAGFPPVAIVDSGVATTHEEFAGGLIDGTSADCTHGTPVAAATPGAVRDAVGHGTVVAALATAPENGFGILGVSPYSSPIVVRITNSPTDLSHLDCGLRFLARAASVGPLVVNLSLAEPNRPSRARRLLIARLVRAGALLVAATGNDVDHVGGPIQFPAALQHVLAVGDSEGRELFRGRLLDVLAPGSGLRVPDWRTRSGYYVPEDATSWSTAIVSGAAAALWGLRAVDNPQQIGYLLRRAATNGARPTTRRGFGTISLARSLALSVPADAEFEPNDTPRLAWSTKTDPVRCPRTSCLVRLRGLAGTTDDAVDWWPLRIRSGQAVRASVGGRVVRLGCPVAIGAGRYAVGVRATAPLAAYAISFRFTAAGAAVGRC